VVRKIILNCSEWSTSILILEYWTFKNRKGLLISVKYHLVYPLFVEAIFLLLLASSISVGQETTPPSAGNLLLYNSMQTVKESHGSLPNIIDSHPSQKIESYSLSIYMAENNPCTLNVEAKMKFKNNGIQREINLLIDTMMSIKSVELDGINRNYSLGYIINKDTLRLQLPLEYSPDSTNEFFITSDYDLSIDSLQTGSNVIYTWYPYQTNNLASYSLKYEGPSQYEIFTPIQLEKKEKNFNRVEFTGCIKEQIPKLTLILSKGILHQKMVKQIGGKQIQFFYCSIKDSSICSRILVDVYSSFDFYNELIGQYAYNHLNLVEITDPAMNYIDSQPALIVIGPKYLKYYGKGFNWPAHEVAHQWIGSGLFTFSQDQKTWCIFEPLAEYLKLLYMESKDSSQKIDSAIQEMLDEYKNEYVGTNKDTSLLESGSTRVTYIKGPYMMNEIRKCLGDSKWREFIRELYREYKGIFLDFNGFHNLLKRFSNDCADRFIELVSHTGLPAK
jgi:hypothetical protein